MSTQVNRKTCYWRYSEGDLVFLPKKNRKRILFKTTKYENRFKQFKQVKRNKKNWHWPSLDVCIWYRGYQYVLNWDDIMIYTTTTRTIYKYKIMNLMYQNVCGIWKYA